MPQKKTETLIEASREVGLEGNTKKIKYMIMSRHQNSGQDHNLLSDNKSFWKCGKVQIFGNNSSKPKLLSVQSLLYSSHALSKNFKIKIFGLSH